MDYLKDYNFSDYQINNVIEAINNQELNINIFKYDEDSIRKVLDYFKAIGIVNLYQILVTNPGLFLDTFGSIKRRIEKYPSINELVQLINDDVTNLSLVGLY